MDTQYSRISDSLTQSQVTTQWHRHGATASPQVSIVLHTHNEGDNTRAVLEGVLAQSTRFPIEILIHDDASTDNTRSIIDEYANRFPDIVQTYLSDEPNQTYKPIFTTLPAASGKYIAICDARGYWTDKSKLIKQVEQLNLSQSTGTLSDWLQAVELAYDFSRFDLLRNVIEYRATRNTPLKDWLHICNTLHERNKGSQAPVQDMDLAYTVLCITKRLSNTKSCRVIKSLFALQGMQVLQEGEGVHHPLAGRHYMWVCIRDGKAKQWNRVVQTIAHHKHQKYGLSNTIIDGFDKLCTSTICDQQPKLRR